MLKLIFFLIAFFSWPHILWPPFLFVPFFCLPFFSMKFQRLIKETYFLVQCRHCKARQAAVVKDKRDKQQKVHFL